MNNTQRQAQQSSASSDTGPSSEQDPEFKQIRPVMNSSWKRSWDEEFVDFTEYPPETDTQSDSDLDHGWGRRKSRKLNGHWQRSLDKGIVDVAKRYSESDTLSDSDLGHGRSRPERRELSHVVVAPLAYPRSAYKGCERQAPLRGEHNALADLVAAFNASGQDETVDCTKFELDDFSVYRPIRSARHPHELASLDLLRNRDGVGELLFDGVLSYGSQKHLVQAVPFCTLAIEGYGDPDVHNLQGHIYIQSAMASSLDVWYQLGRPSAEYSRFHRPFVWLAEFAKHFIDFLLENEQVVLGDFRKRFLGWLCARHEHILLLPWLKQCHNLRDFRTTIAAHVGFLWKECWSIDDAATGLCSHPIWGEVDPERLWAIPKQPNLEEHTVVTSYAYACFRHMYFGHHLRERGITDINVLDKVDRRKRELSLTPHTTTVAGRISLPSPTSVSGSPKNSQTTCSISAGDVVVVDSNIGSDSKWLSSTSVWYAYVQATRRIKLELLLDVLWLYSPCDTTLGKAFYPFENELFFSDNCSCGKDAINASCVIGKADITWFASDPDQSNLFVRQKFRTVHEDDTYDFVTLKKSDFRCECNRHVSAWDDCRTKFKVGDTVLVKERDKTGQTILGPGQIVEFDVDKEKVLLRRFERQRDSDSRSRPNQLLATRRIVPKAAKQIIRRCSIRVFAPDTIRMNLPMPFSLNGAGDFFFVASSDETTAYKSEFFEGRAIPLPSLESWTSNFRQACEKLQGLGIFCGGGNFDRGLEDGGAVEFRYAVDWAQQAIHSYRANVENPESSHYFHGSVNDYLSLAIAGSNNESVATPGIGVISAGSPCPGFSLLQLDKYSAQSQRNASMVASVVSFVDFYSPKYCILENVVTMATGMGRNKDENVFSQIIGALVGLGYQVQQFQMNPYSFGDSQSRARIFIVASAPGLEPFRPPPYTHDNPEHSDRRLKQRALGRSSNGLPFGRQRSDYTPFPHVSPREAVQDLPNITDAQVQICPAFPDHRTAVEQNGKSRDRIASIPLRPYGLGVAQAARQGLPSPALLRWHASLNQTKKMAGSKTYSRVYPDHLFPTILTTHPIACGRTGRHLHWEQHRTLTIMELKRAQGFLDHEVIVGRPSQQLAVIGNSVDRKVGFALGLELYNSWMKNEGMFPEAEDVLEQVDDYKGPIEAEGDIDNERRITERKDRPLSQQQMEDLLQDPTNAFKRIASILKERQEGAFESSNITTGSTNLSELLIDAPGHPDMIL